jgi:hypothetical protein
MTVFSFDGSPFRIRMDSPQLVCFDPLALDLLRELSLSGSVQDERELLQRANTVCPAVACFTIPHFRPGLYQLDPREIRKFGGDDDAFDYEDEEATEAGDVDPGSATVESAYPFVGVDSGRLIVADMKRLPEIVRQLTWEQYDLALRDEAVFDRIAEAVGALCFAVIKGGGSAEMEFDGDGTYTIAVGSLRRVGD